MYQEVYNRELRCPHAFSSVEDFIASLNGFGVINGEWATISYHLRDHSMHQQYIASRKRSHSATSPIVAPAPIKIPKHQDPTVFHAPNTLGTTRDRVPPMLQISTNPAIAPYSTVASALGLMTLSSPTKETFGTSLPTPQSTTVPAPRSPTDAMSSILKSPLLLSFLLSHIPTTAPGLSLNELNDLFHSAVYNQSPPDGLSALVDLTRYLESVKDDIVIEKVNPSDMSSWRVTRKMKHRWEYASLPVTPVSPVGPPPQVFQNVLYPFVTASPQNSHSNSVQGSCGMNVPGLLMPWAIQPIVRNSELITNNIKQYPINDILPFRGELNSPDPDVEASSFLRMMMDSVIDQTASNV
ncbi:hypothetical protein M427DRAFT_195109 [Gonapodya prolifera JEL478]|uniref:Uncharacterized protein n=1 Tax=Gonapodya prolifera (strain JEL478) TaxID=1344416 RepID=A0A139APB1_GONPJ|nr:hypothetical protein M427DRAFT_195109 [Gonapodya prolifera JEL478]|eukprot:KXS18580.1 hypothetical protein M427DRAFT_195109 [Gonapodya prolifera JEL478]